MAVDHGKTGDLIVDDFGSPILRSLLGTGWRGVSDRVMGGISEATVTHTVVDERPCMRLTGAVRLENDGGFIQASLDLDPEGGTLNAKRLAGVRLLVSGNGETYNVHLRTPDNTRSWQSYRARFVAEPGWREIRLPFPVFEPHRLEAPLDTGRLRRIGVVAIGRAFHADLAVAELAFFAHAAGQTAIRPGTRP